MKNTELDFDWSVLPEFVNWVAMDSKGNWYGYDVKPVPTLTGRWSILPYGGNQFCKIDKIKFDGHWYQSLFKVPKNKAE